MGWGGEGREPLAWGVGGPEIIQSLAAHSETQNKTAILITFDLIPLPSLPWDWR